MSPSRGFTLAEMAIAVVILALLLFGAMVPLSAQLEIRNVAETRRTMDSIRDAIIGFAQANGRLPCPANGAIASGATGAGTEQFGTGPNINICAAPIGVVPWVTLGTPEVDAWQRRFTYRVSPAFADLAAASTWATTAPPSPGSQNQACPTVPSGPMPSPPTTFALCSLGDIAVFTRTVSTSVAQGSALPVVFISHGKNGFGAWQSTGTRLPLPATGTDEAANANGNTTALPAPSGSYLQQAFYSRNPTPAVAGCVDPTPPGTSSGSPLCEFDDIVVTISSTALIARMVAAGRLP